MSRTDVLRKLIALEPITAGQIHAVCGWPAGDVDRRSMNCCAPAW